MSGREDDSLSHPSWAMAGLWREAASKQCWLCSKGKAAFVCQYGYSWVKSVVFYKSLLCLGAVGLGILGTRGKVQVAAPSRQTAACGRAPNHTLHLCLLKRALPAAEPDVELVSHSFTRPRPNPSAPLGLHGSCQGRKAASSGPRRWQGGVTGTSLGDPGSPAASGGTCGGSSWRCTSQGSRTRSSFPTA